MLEHSDRPGPGEQPAPDISAPNVVRGPLPEGDRVFAGVPTGHPVGELRESLNSEHESARDGLRAEGYGGAAIEQRQDRCAEDLLRETVFDPVQDNAGPEKG